MSKYVVTNVTVLSVNEIPDSEAERIMEKYDVDELSEVATKMEEEVELHLSKRVFANADKIPVVSVDAQVENELDVENISDKYKIDSN